MQDVGYKFLHRMIVIHCIYFVCLMINNKIPEDGISRMYLMRKVIFGFTMKYNKL